MAASHYWMHHKERRKGEIEKDIFPQSDLVAS